MLFLPAIESKSLIRLCIYTFLSEPLFVAHTTLLEISCCGSYMDLLAALKRNASTCYNWFILLWSQEHGCRPILANLNLTLSIRKLPVITFSKKAWTYMFCIYVYFFDMKTNKNEIKKVGLIRIRTYNLRIWSYSDLPHDHRGKYNLIEFSTDLIAIVPRCLFP